MPKLRLPLVVQNSTRNPSASYATYPDTDSRMINCYITSMIAADGKKKVGLTMRPGFSTDTVRYATATTGTGRGVFSIDQGTTTWNVVDGILYENTTSRATGLTNNLTQPVDWTRINIQSTGNYEGCVGDGDVAFLFKSGSAATQITNANFPSDNITNPVFFSNYLFVGDLDTNRIYNSSLSDPTTWSALGYVTPTAFGDMVRGLWVYNHYLAVFKEYTIEFYEDKGTTPSPLALIKPALQHFGCLHRHTIKEVDGDIIFLSNDTGKRKRVSVLTNNFQIKHISTPWVEQVIQGISDTEIALNRAELLTVESQTFYVLTVKNAFNSALITLVYDFDEGQWYHWTSTEFTDNIIPIGGVLNVPTIGMTWQNRQNGKVYSSAFNDHWDGDTSTGDSVIMQVLTPKLDMNNSDIKYLNSVELVHSPKANKSPGSDGTGITYDRLPTTYITWSKDDYSIGDDNNWSGPSAGTGNTQGRKVADEATTWTVLNGRYKRMRCFRGGYFRRIAFRITQSLSKSTGSRGIPIWEALEIDYDAGENSAQNLDKGER